MYLLPTILNSPPDSVNSLYMLASFVAASPPQRLHENLVSIQSLLNFVSFYVAMHWVCLLSIFSSRLSVFL
jgi:hypothetical protein